MCLLWGFWIGVDDHFEQALNIFQRNGNSSIWGHKLWFQRLRESMSKVVKHYVGCWWINWRWGRRHEDNEINQNLSDYQSYNSSSSVSFWLSWSMPWVCPVCPTVPNNPLSSETSWFMIATSTRASLREFPDEKNDEISRPSVKLMINTEALNYNMH